jgi:folate-dependent phosphoribosylglycinamide formyltransferase PurN
MKRVLYITTPGPRAVPVLDTLLELDCTPLVYIPNEEHFDGRKVTFWQPRWMSIARRILRIIDKLFPLTPPPSGETLAERCHAEGISVNMVPGNSRLNDSVDYFTELNIDLVVVNNYPFLIGKAFLDKFSGRVVNFHSSHLPSYRGLNQSLRILANLEPSGGVTLHFVTPGADTGSIIAQERFALPPDADLTYYKRQVAEGAARILRDSWPRLQAGTSGTPQSHTDQPVVIIDEPTSRVLRWLNKQRRRFGLPLRKI